MMAVLAELSYWDQVEILLVKTGPQNGRKEKLTPMYLFHRFSTVL